RGRPDRHGASAPARIGDPPQATQGPPRGPGGRLMAPGNTSSGSRQRQRSTQESAGRATVGANGDGADHDADEDGDDRANLPAVRERPERRPSPLRRYADIPGELTEALRSIVNRHELRTGEPIPDAVAVTSSVPGE